MSDDNTSGEGGKPERKVALVTGGSGGIGEAFAVRLAADGYSLVLVARNNSELSRVSGLITARHDLPVATINLDLSQPDAVDEIDRELERIGVRPEVIVNNAGFGLVGASASLDRDRQLQMIDLNIRVLTELSLRYLDGMVEAGRGGIINVASTAAFLPGPNMAVYYATKAYVLSFTEALATELKGTGVTATAVCPGPVRTGFQAAAGINETRLLGSAPAMTAQAVAEMGYEGFLKGRRTVVPGFANKLTKLVAPLVPRSVLLPVVAFIQSRRK